MLQEHIADEDGQILPAMRRYLSASAYRRCERQIQRNAPLSRRRFSTPWLARHARPDERRRLLAACGWTARLRRTSQARNNGGPLPSPTGHLATARGNTFLLNHNIDPAAWPAHTDHRGTHHEAPVRHHIPAPRGIPGGNDLPRLGPVPTEAEIIAHYAGVTGTVGLVVHDVPREPDPHVSRPNGAPAYY
jgi:hypothetical protein